MFSFPPIPGFGPGSSCERFLKGSSEKQTHTRSLYNPRYVIAAPSVFKKKGFLSGDVKDGQAGSAGQPNGAPSRYLKDPCFNPCHNFGLMRTLWCRKRGMSGKRVMVAHLGDAPYVLTKVSSFQVLKVNASTTTK